METVKPYKTKKFWIVAVLTLIGLTLASGVVMADSKIAEAVGWVVTFFASMGLKGWVPSPTVDNSGS